MPKLFLTFDEQCQLGDTLRNIHSHVSELASSAGPKGTGCDTLKVNVEKLRAALDRIMREDFAYLPETVFAPVY